MGTEAGGKGGLSQAGGLKHRGRSTHDVGDVEGLKDTSRGGVEELAVRGGGRGRMGGHSGDTGGAGDTSRN